MNADRLLALYDHVADAPNAIVRLRSFALDLAVRGKLVEQDATDEPATELLSRFASEKERLVKAGEIRKPKPLAPIGMVDFTTDLPLTWEIGRLGNLSSAITKGSTPTSYGYSFPKSGINFIKVESIVGGRVSRESISSFVSDAAHQFLARSKLKTGDILFSIAGSIGTCALVTPEIIPANTNQALAIIRGTSFVYDADFLIVVLRSFVSQAVKKKARGGAMNNVSLADLKNLVVPLPPLTEQHRIVAKVDELMALCDQLVASRNQRELTSDRLTKASFACLSNSETNDETFRSQARFTVDALPAMTARAEQVKHLRKNILNLAVRGKLVKQNPNDEPVTSVLERRGVAISNLSPFKIPSSWAWGTCWHVSRNSAWKNA